MSELKAINAYQLTTNTEDSDVYIHNNEFGCGGDLVECYLKSDVDKLIAELKDKCQMHDFFWEGCGFDKLGFKNAINVRDYCDKLKKENESLKAENESLKHEVATLDTDIAMMKRWRKCSEELPHCTGIYLVCIAGHARTIDVFNSVRKLWRNFNPTHWMPLPDRPQEDK